QPDDKFCTDDFCRSGQGCVHDPIAGCCETVTAGNTPSTEPICDDGIPCTLDQCAADHTCTHTIIPKCCLVDGDCDDNNACTSDTCDQSTTPPHCSNLAAHEGDSCVSDDVCTNSAAKCSGGTCIGEPLDCPPDPDDP